MAFSTVKHGHEGGFIVTLDDGTTFHVPDNDANRHKGLIDEWVAGGGIIGPGDALPLPLTNEEIYDQTVQNRKAFKAYVLAVNDGSIVPGSNMTLAALKAAVVAKM